jgi:hypothetical protein
MLKTFIGTYTPDFNSIPSAVPEKKFLEKLGRDVSCEFLKSCPGLY